MLGDQQISGQLNKDGSLVRNKKATKSGNEGGPKKADNKEGEFQPKQQNYQRNDEQKPNEPENKFAKKGTDSWRKTITLIDPPGYPSTYPSTRIIEEPSEAEHHMLMSAKHIKRIDINKKKLNEVAQKLKFEQGHDQFEFCGYDSVTINTSKRNTKQSKQFTFTKLDF